MKHTATNLGLVAIFFAGDWGKKLKRNDVIQLEGVVSKIKYEAKVSLAGMTVAKLKKDRDKDKEPK